MLKVKWWEGPSHESHNIGFYIYFDNKINIMLSSCQATDMDSNLPEYAPTSSCLFQEKIRFNLMYFIALAADFFPPTAARTRKTLKI